MSRSASLVRRLPSERCNDPDLSADRWFKEGVDVNTVEISETHW